ncbi:MAG TPA: ABC transporter permease [Candidatus Brocadiia bacterium]|nr:ABC transporter permease [Candidatus Brocadiia bacterium]
MDLIESFDSAFETLWHSKMRSLLTMLGVIIGVIAVIVLVALGEGTKKFVTDTIIGFGMGANVLLVNPGKEGQPSSVSALTYGDARALREDVPGVEILTPVLVGSAYVKYGLNDYMTLIIGVSDDYPNIVHRNIGRGRFYTEFEVRSRRRVCVMGTEVAEAVFGNVEPIGERVAIKGQKFTIVGTLEEKGELFGFDLDDLVCIPNTTAESLLGSKQLDQIVILTKGPEVLSTVRSMVYDIMKKRHRDREDFHTQTQDEVLSILDKIISKFTVAVTTIAAISLVVGGIGITNIMLVSVTERTREIGVRKSIGASNEHIFYQFLTEAVLISVFGGGIGLAFSLFACAVLGKVLGFAFVIPNWAIIMGLTFSIVVGVISGVYPAVRASRLNPIDALRHE